MYKHLQYPDLMKKVFVITCLAFFALVQSCFAQQGVSGNDNYKFDFLPREKVVFEDNFSQDAIGAFPSKWRRLGPGASRSPKHCNIQDDDGHVLVISDIICDVEPNIDADSYLADSFTLEFDFMLGKDSLNTVDIDFRAKHSGSASYDWFMITGNGIASYFNMNTGAKQTCIYPAKFTPLAWHHLAIAYQDGIFNLYIDQYHLLTAKSYYGYPMFSFGMHCRPPGKWKNVRLATGKKSNVINEPVTEKESTKHPATSLTVYPNPDQKSLTLKVASAVKENVLVTITNMVGEKVKDFMTITNTDKEVQLDVPPGIYCISAVTKDKTLTAKIVME